MSLIVAATRTPLVRRMFCPCLMRPNIRRMKTVMTIARAKTTTIPIATMMPAPVMKYCSAGGTFGITGLPSREFSENEANDNDSDRATRFAASFRRL